MQLQQLNPRMQISSGIMQLTLCSQVIHAAVLGDKEQVIECSKTLGFITGYESKVGGRVYANLKIYVDRRL